MDLSPATNAGRGVEARRLTIHEAARIVAEVCGADPCAAGGAEARLLTLWWAPRVTGQPLAVVAAWLGIAPRSAAALVCRVKAGRSARQLEWMRALLRVAEVTVDGLTP